ncbi:hypothetical protein [Marinomonas epiphytica]
MISMAFCLMMGVVRSMAHYGLRPNGALRLAVHDFNGVLFNHGCCATNGALPLMVHVSMGFDSVMGASHPTAHYGLRPNGALRLAVHDFNGILFNDGCCAINGALRPAA